MLDRQFGQIVVECDACGDTLQTETKDFAEAREAMKAAGWRVRAEGQGRSAVWYHGCPDCGVPTVGLFARNERGKR